MSFDLETTGQALLAWLYDRGGPHEFMSVNAFVATKDLPDTAAHTLATDLKSRGLIAAEIAFGGHADAILTPSGTRHVQEIRRRREDPVYRIPALRKQMLLWLFSVERINGKAHDWSDFLSSKYASFLGDRFIKSEMDHEVAYLVDRGLITTNARVDSEVNGWFYPRLTADGRDCITEHGGAVSDFLRSRNGGATYHFSDNSGAISVNSRHVTQTVSHGVDTAVLLKFAEAAAQMLPVLDGIPDDERGELQECAAAVQAEAAQTEPNISKLRELFNVLYRGVMKASSTVATDMLIGLGHDASQALGIGS